MVDRYRRLRMVLVGSWVLWAFPQLAFSQSLQVQPSIGAGLTWTNNANFGAEPTPHSDLIADVSPALRLYRAGADLKIEGTVGFDEIAYANGTHPSQLLPHANLGLNATFAPNLLYLDAGVVSTQSTENAYGPRSSGVSPVNSYTSTQYRLSPYLDRELSPTLRVTLRSDNTLTTSHGATVALNDGLFQRHALRVVRNPVPLGLTFEAERDVTRYTGDMGTALTHDGLRAEVMVSGDPQLVAAVIGGYERYDFGIAERQEGNIYGARIEWHPTERSLIDTRVEHHYFGQTWALAFTHHAPRLALDLRWTRQASTYAERAFTLPAGGDVLGLLNAAFTTRYPDPIARANAVQQFLDQRGIPTSLQSAVNLYSNRLNLYNAVTASVVMIGALNTATLSVYRARTEDFHLPTQQVIIDILPLNLVQRGANFSLSHRLSPTEALVGTYAWADTRGLAPSTLSRSIQSTYVLQYTTMISARTDGVLGIRRQWFNSTAITNATESAAFVGATHRF